MRLMFFCYERNKVDGQFQPVVYYDEAPRPSSQSKESTPDRSTVWPVPEDCTKNSEPMFGKLQKRFKRPA